MEVWWGMRCGNLHVASVAEVDAGLVRTLVGSVLEWDDVLPGLELLVAEVPDVLLRLLWPDRWLSKVASLQFNLKVIWWTSQQSKVGSLFAQATASRWRPSSSSDAPTSRPIGKSPELAHRRPWRLPRTRWCSPCIWRPFCSRWHAWRCLAGVRWPICREWRRPWGPRRSCPCRLRCWSAHRWPPWSILSSRQLTRRCTLSWSKKNKKKTRRSER